MLAAVTFAAMSADAEWKIALANHVRITAFDLMDQTDNTN